MKLLWAPQLASSSADLGLHRTGEGAKGPIYMQVYACDFSLPYHVGHANSSQVLFLWVPTASKGWEIEPRRGSGAKSGWT